VDGATEVTPSLNLADRAQIRYEARGLCLILQALGTSRSASRSGRLPLPSRQAIARWSSVTDLCPSTAEVAASIIAQAFDESEVALVEGGVSVATALLRLPFNHIFFTGSTRVGKIVMAAAAKHLASVTLELGGKSPVILDLGADIDKVAASLPRPNSINGGQACISPDYVFVREEQQAQLVEGLRPMPQKPYDEAGTIKKESIAQIVNQANFNRVKALFDDAVAQGATVAVGGPMDESAPHHPPHAADGRHPADEDPAGRNLRACAAGDELTKPSIRRSTTSPRATSRSRSMSIRTTRRISKRSSTAPHRAA